MQSCSAKASGRVAQPTLSPCCRKLRAHIRCELSRQDSKRGLSELFVSQVVRKVKRVQQAIVTPHKVNDSGLQGLHKPATVVLLPAYLLGAVATCAGVPGPHWLPVVTGALIGSFFAFLDRWCKVQLWKEPNRPLNVVITGSSKGIGKALAREFLHSGDRVVISARSEAGLKKAVAQLKSELGQDVVVFGVACDVSDAGSVNNLTNTARSLLDGNVDVWINNAGYSSSFQTFLQSSPEQLQQVVTTNLLGTLLCSQQAIDLFQKQPQGGHLFNVDGAGADGSPTPMYAAYGATKAGIAQLSKSLQAELSKKEKASIHTLSPGMVLTDLLLEGATEQNKQVFNILCEHPETVAAFLVPRVKSVVARGERNTYIKFLTPASALCRFLTAPARFNRFFDNNGQPVYPSESERIYGRHAKKTARAAERARERTGALAVAYSLSLLVSVVVLLETAQGVHLV